jgi:hypothetical protein
VVLLAVPVDAHFMRGVEQFVGLLDRQWFAIWEEGNG